MACGGLKVPEGRQTIHNDVNERIALESPIDH
jgi:hypothetical protein